MLRQKRLERIVEDFIWSMRFLTIIPVFFGLISVVALFWLGSLEIIRGLKGYEYLSEDEAKAVTLMMGGIIGGIDLYLIGIVLILFSFGVYELFISKLDVGRANQEIRILEIRSLDQLKDKILKVVVMVLVVSFFKKVMEMQMQSTLDLLYLAISILLIAASGYLLHNSPAHKNKQHSDVD